MMIDIIFAAAAGAYEQVHHSDHSLWDVVQQNFAIIWPILCHAVSMISIAVGLFFVFSGTLGVLRFPDFFTRIHAAGMTDTLGLELILLGLIIQSGFSLLSLKFLLVGFFLLLTSPTATHAIADAAYTAGLKPLLGRYRTGELDDNDRPAETQL